MSNPLDKLTAGMNARLNAGVQQMAARALAWLRQPCGLPWWVLGLVALGCLVGGHFT
jgi:hypothetical protein